MARVRNHPLDKQLRRHEGLRLKPYRDTMGLLTIGYGRNLDAKGISKEEAELLLENDIDEASGELIIALPWTLHLDQVRREVLINMVFNLGINGLLGFTRTLEAIEAGNYAAAAGFMLQSKWATQVGQRAVELAKQMETGERGKD